MFSAKRPKRRHVVAVLWEKQEGRCHYCCRLTRMDATIEDGDQATLEHIKPRSKKGPRYGRNTVMACRDCNSTRGDIDYGEFMGLVKMAVRYGYPIKFGKRALFKLRKAVKKMQRQRSSNL